MSNQKVKIDIKCCNCDKTFEYTFDKEQMKGEQVVFCPFCRKKCKVDFRQNIEKTEVYRGVKV